MYGVSRPLRELAAGSRDTIAVLTVNIGCPCRRPAPCRLRISPGAKGSIGMSFPWWAFALVALVDIGDDRPSLTARAICYTAAFLLVLAVVILWL
jgi:hypothetical protein